LYSLLAVAVDAVDKGIEFFVTFLRFVNVNLMTSAIDEHNLGPLDLFVHRLLIPKSVNQQEPYETGAAVLFFGANIKVGV
jgi:hypothetical protein